MIPFVIQQSRTPYFYKNAILTLIILMFNDITQPAKLVVQNIETKKTTLDLSLLDFPSTDPIFDCLLILNNNFEQWLLDVLINKARYVIASDGGANKLYKSVFRDVGNFHCIIGDLDSLEAEVKDYYQQNKVKVIEDHDQNSNDFQKAVQYAHRNGMKDMVVIGALGGRIDQQLCNLSAIQKFSKSNGQRFIALGTSSLMFLLKAGEMAQITVGKLCKVKQVGIFSFGKSEVTTTGFQWNIDPKTCPPLEWGKFVSSSNVIISQKATIQTENPIFFTIELRKPDFLLPNL